MRLTDEIFRALQRAVNTLGSLDAVAKEINVKTETLSQFVNRSTDIIRKETWDKLYPIVKPYMPPDAAAEADDEQGEPPEPPSHARVHRDLASLSSDEKILLDAFNDLPPELQQQKLLELTELARKNIAQSKL